MISSLLRCFGANKPKSIPTYTNQSRATDQKSITYDSFGIRSREDNQTEVQQKVQEKRTLLATVDQTNNMDDIDVDNSDESYFSESRTQPLNDSSYTHGKYSSTRLLSPRLINSILEKIQPHELLEIHPMATNIDIPSFNPERLEDIHAVLKNLPNDNKLHLIPYGVEKAESTWSNCLPFKPEDHAVLIVCHNKKIILIDPKNKNRNYGLDHKAIQTGFELQYKKLPWQSTFDKSNCGRYTCWMADKIAVAFSREPEKFDLNSFVEELKKLPINLKEINKKFESYF